MERRGTLINMRSAQVSELRERLDEVIEAVKDGETVEIREGDQIIADIVPSVPRCGIRYATLSVPEETVTSLGQGNEIRDGAAASIDRMPDQSALERHLDELVRQGKARRGTGTLPPDFLTRPLPKAKKSVLEALLEDRNSD